MGVVRQGGPVGKGRGGDCNGRFRSSRFGVGRDKGPGGTKARGMRGGKQPTGERLVNRGSVRGHRVLKDGKGGGEERFLDRQQKQSWETARGGKEHVTDRRETARKNRLGAIGMALLGVRDHRGRLGKNQRGEKERGRNIKGGWTDEKTGKGQRGEG